MFSVSLSVSLPVQKETHAQNYYSFLGHTQRGKNMQKNYVQLKPWFTAENQTDYIRQYCSKENKGYMNDVHLQPDS